MAEETVAVAEAPAPAIEIVDAVPEATASEPVKPTAPAVQPAVPAIPKDRFDEVRVERNELRRETAELKAQIAEINKNVTGFISTQEQAKVQSDLEKIQDIHRQALERGDFLRPNRRFNKRLSTKLNRRYKWPQ